MRYTCSDDMAAGRSSERLRAVRLTGLRCCGWYVSQCVMGKRSRYRSETLVRCTDIALTRQEGG